MYIWVDGIDFNVRLSPDRPCILVVIGATAEGVKELLAVHDGERESELSWTEVIRDLQRLGMRQAPMLAIGDGALGYWNALEKLWTATRKQRCWVRKTANRSTSCPSRCSPRRRP